MVYAPFEHIQFLVLIKTHVTRVHVNAAIYICQWRRRRCSSSIGVGIDLRRFTA